MNRGPRSWVVVAAAATTLVATLGGATGAVAAEDATPPALQVGDFKFIAGTALSEMQPSPDGLMSETSADARVRWSASDDSGICGYRWRTLASGGGGYNGDFTRWSERTRLRVWVDDDVGQLGGGPTQVDAFQIQARDCAGNKASATAWNHAFFYQDDGQSFAWGTLPLQYTGNWGVSNCLCWSGGTTRKTYQAGASVEFEAPAGSMLVMETAPNRGRAQIWVNGQLARTIDTYAPVTEHRVMFRIPGEGTVKVVNLGTPGRPRIDLDAIAMMDQPSSIQ